MENLGTTGLIRRSNSYFS